MENLIISFRVVAPLIILMLLGFGMLRLHIFDSDTVKKMNGVVFKVFLPALIFNNIYNSSIYRNHHYNSFGYARGRYRSSDCGTCFSYCSFVISYGSSNGGRWRTCGTDCCFWNSSLHTDCFYVGVYN